MEYTIHQLAELSGVSTRTLRWYDKLELLPPARIADNGYRIYGPEQVDRLQQILFYRALGVELRQIKTILDDPSFDRLHALREHLGALQEKERQIGQIIQSVRETILAAERNEIMSDEAKFQAFKHRAVEENERRYGREIRAAYGDQAVDEAHAAVLNLTMEQYQQWTQMGAEIQRRLEQAVTQACSPQDEVGRDITQLHRQWLSYGPNQYDVQKHKGLAQLYVCDARFQKYYDKNCPGCAQFLRDAILHWAK